MVECTTGCAPLRDTSSAAAAADCWTHLDTFISDSGDDDDNNNNDDDDDAG